MDHSTQLESPWPRRLACALVCATFPLIWVGGLVTTYDAGMAVPDWPSTYGYNLFLYPWTTWLFGPFDLFIEHGHRLLGALTGMITLALTWSVWRNDDRTWMRRLCLAAAALVIFQGCLGGARVLLNERQIAQLHGCVGPAFFALAAAIAAMHSRWWFAAKASVNRPGDVKFRRLAVITAALVYLQLAVGSVVRHASPMMDHRHFQAAVIFHIIVGFVVAGHIIAMNWRAVGAYSNLPALWGPPTLLTSLVLLQLSLGAASWVVKYSWPAWMTSWSFAAGHTIQADSYFQGLIVTMHVAGGSLILAVAVVAALRAYRFTGPVMAAVAAAPALGAGAAA